VNKVFLAKVPGSVIIHSDRESGKNLASPFSTFSYQVTFVASFGVNGTPMWKLTALSVNPSSPLFSASHQRTQDLTISIGKTKPATKTNPAVPSAEMVALHKCRVDWAGGCDGDSKSKSNSTSHQRSYPMSKSRSHVTKLLQSDRKFKSLVTKYGRPRVRGPKNIRGIKAGDICMMTECYRGKKIVMRRDRNGNCTEYSEEPC
jgi:hypothetical protein